MMDIMETIREERAEEARVWKKKENFIKYISNEIYPDKAHFIYELLQNAEDTGATLVRFDLHKDKLLFEHDGRTFNEQDLRAITDFCESPKESDKIGRFGIGFKAVYNYTETPHIWSPSYSFKISDYCLPYELKPEAELKSNTRFMFPFDKPGKKQADIYMEINNGLNDISRNTLLFLGNIKLITCMRNGKEATSITRFNHPQNRVEIKQIKNGKALGSTHYLLFKKGAKHLKGHHVALAYELQPSSSDITESNNTNATFKIKVAHPGNVAVYLAAENEVSNLKFHLHAPFVPAGNRSVIQDSDENQILIEQLAALASESLPLIKKWGLLDSNFLEVLPNMNDDLPEKYDCIRVAIVEAMQKKPLTPTHSKTHLPAKDLWRGSMNVRRLLSGEDIKFWYQESNSRKVDWVTGVRPGRATNFLNDLELETWNSVEFAKIFIDKVGESKTKQKKTHDWLNKKPDEWLRFLYALLNEVVGNFFIRQQLEELEIVRVAHGGYKSASECFFSSLDDQWDEQYPRVAIETYQVGRKGNEDETERNAREFLGVIGVRNLGPLQQIEVLLNKKYSDEIGLKIKWEDYLSDIFKFIKISNEDSESKDLIKEYNIFLSSNNILTQPENIYLDSPYSNTGLKAYYDLVEPEFDETIRLPLSKRYMKLSKEQKTEFIEFAKNCGVATNLMPRLTTCKNNPDYAQLRSAHGDSRPSYYEIDQDFVVDQLDLLIKEPSEDLSKLIWSNLEYWHNKHFKAKYQPNKHSDPSYASSQLLHLLIGSDWVPQNTTKSVRYVCPAEAKLEQLPDDFSCPPNALWLEQIGFGQGMVENEELRGFAKRVGLGSIKEVVDAVKIKKLLEKLHPEIYKELEEQDNVQLPEPKSKNPDRRKKQVREGAKKAPKREVTSKEVNVSNVDTVKQDQTRPYLQYMYTGDDGMICQVCRHELPFKLPNGEYYFEMVEIFNDLERIHHQNYIALCPNHAAMYKHANDSKKEMKKQFEDLKEGEQYLKLTLAGQPMKLYFATNHINDLKEVIDVEKQLLKSRKQ